MSEENRKLADKIGVVVAPGGTASIGTQIIEGKKQLTPTKFIPYRGSVNFVGRETELAKLHEYLQEGDDVSIAGMGGVGKTELATQYAHRYQKEYDGILWFNSRDRDLAGEILKFFRLEFEYEIPQQDWQGKLLNTKEQVAWCWRKYPESNLPILVIFDDVIDLEKLQDVLPKYLRFQVVITTRQKLLDNKKRKKQIKIRDLPLDVLSPEKEPEKASELLQLSLGESGKRVSREPEAATALCECLGYLPLGIELVGGYLAADPDLSLSVMERQLQEKKLANPALRDSRFDEVPIRFWLFLLRIDCLAGVLFLCKFLESLDPLQRGVRAAFVLTWAKLSPHAQQLGKLLSLFAPKQIAWDLVLRVARESETEEEEKQLKWSEKEINEAKKQLYQRNILQLAEGEQKYYQVHSLARWFLQERLLESAEIHSVLATIFIQALAMNQRLYVEDHPYVANSLNNLAALYSNQGRYPEAEPLLRQALEMNQRLYEGDHPAVATSVNNLALLYNNQGRYPEAEPLYLQALAMNQRLYVEDHPDVARDLNNLALLYDNQGRYSEAEPLYLQALEMSQRTLGLDHPSTITVQDNLKQLRQQLTPLSIWTRRLFYFIGLLLGIVILPFYLLWLLVKQVWNFVVR